MTYEEMRQRAGNGDALIVKGGKFFSWWVRVLTAESASHVSFLFWESDGGLWIAEFVEGQGFIRSPASQRIKEYSGTVFFGKAPKVVQDNPDDALDAMLSFRHAPECGKKYGYWTLVKVWWGRIRGKQFKTPQEVCSTFGEEIWRACGYYFPYAPAPGDYLDACDYVAKVETA